MALTSLPVNRLLSSPLLPLLVSGLSVFNLSIRRLWIFCPVSVVQYLSGTISRKRLSFSRSIRDKIAMLLPEKILWLLFWISSNRSFTPTISLVFLFAISGCPLYIYFDHLVIINWCDFYKRIWKNLLFIIQWMFLLINMLENLSLEYIAKYSFQWVSK